MLPEVISGSIGIVDTIAPIRRLCPKTNLYTREVESINLENKSAGPYCARAEESTGTAVTASFTMVSHGYEGRAPIDIVPSNDTPARNRFMTTTADLIASEPCLFCGQFSRREPSLEIDWRFAGSDFCRAFRERSLHMLLAQPAKSRRMNIILLSALGIPNLQDCCPPEIGIVRELSSQYPTSRQL